MPYASQSSTRMPAACAPYARSAIPPRLLSCGEIFPSWRLCQQNQELFHRNFLLVFLGWGLLGLVKYRRTWERMGSGGLRGPQNRCEACKTSWMCSIHIRSRHTLPALLCSRSCCVPQRRCFVFARAFRSAAISVAVFSFVHRVSSMPMEVFLPYDYRKTGRSFLCRPGGRAVLAHGLR